MDVKRRSRPSGGQLLDEQELSAGLLGGGFHGHQHPEKPQCLSILRAKRVGGGVSVHKHSPSFLPLLSDRYLSHRYDAIQRTLAHMLGSGLPLFTELPRRGVLGNRKAKGQKGPAPEGAPTPEEGSEA